MGAPNTAKSTTRSGAVAALREAPRRTARSLRGHFRSPGSPRIWFELVLIAVSYWVYSQIRNAVPQQEAAAERNALHIHHLEQHLGIATEKAVNHAIDKVDWLIVSMNYYYATLHFVFTIGVLVWLFRKHPGRYAAARMVLFATTGLALIGFYFFPLAPPRLLHGGGFIDTVEVHNTWGSLSSGDMASVSNQFAAMPSMHIGWSLWVGLTVAVLARHRWVKVVGAIYPVFTLTVIIATANHFFLDAVGGVVALGLGFAVARLMYGRWAYRFPKYPRGAGTVAPAEAAVNGSTRSGAGSPAAPEASVPRAGEAQLGAAHGSTSASAVEESGGTVRGGAERPARGPSGRRAPADRPAADRPAAGEEAARDANRTAPPPESARAAHP